MTAATPAHFDVFLSHNSKDKPAVEQIARKLRNRGIEPFLDTWYLSGGGMWQAELGAYLHASFACAVFLGPHGRGDWQDEEMMLANTLSANKQKDFRAFVVLLPGYADTFEPTSLPFPMSNRTWIDFRRDLNNADTVQRFINAIKGVPDGPPVVVANDDVCPYRGLRAFDEDHATFFFGRQRDTQRLVEKLKGTRFLAVLGPSGSGKSSLVRAGLLPQLRDAGLPGSERWPIHVFTPGARPIESLAAHCIRAFSAKRDTPETLALMRRTVDELHSDERTLHLGVAHALLEEPTSARMVWVVDQFEEIFTLCQDGDERSRFIDAIVYASSIPGGQSIVILTLRADFYARCAAYPDLAARMAEYQYLVSPMEDTDLRQAIQAPAWQVGLEFEPGLAETIFHDIKNQPGSLPLLEHALLELWERRAGRILTLAAYRESGGVAGAVAQRAEAIFEGFTPEQQAIARRTILRLTQPGEGSEDTRRRAAMSELVTHAEEGAAVAQVVTALTDARLLTTSGEAATADEYVDVSHEALIRGWERLRGWIAEDREGLRVHRRLTEAARDWERLGREESALYRGARLAAVIEWEHQNHAALNSQEHAFLDASTALQLRERRIARRRIQTAVGGLTTGLVVVGIVALFALVQRQTATQQRDAANRAEAEAVTQQHNARTDADRRGTAEAQAISDRNSAIQQQQVAKSRELAASALTQLAIDPELSLLLAREAMNVMPTNQAEDALRRALLASRVRVTVSHQGAVLAAQFSPDGATIATASADRTAKIWDATNGTALQSLFGHMGAVTCVAFSPDGKTIITTSVDRTARLWDVATGKELRSLTGHTDRVNTGAFSPDGKTIVTASVDRTARLWDVATGKELRSLTGHTDAVNSAAFSPDGATIVTASEDRTARLWDFGAGNSLRTLTNTEQEEPEELANAVFSPDGRSVFLSAVATGTVRMWDLKMNKEVRTFTGTLGLSHVAVSDDGAYLVTARHDGAATIWAVQSGEAVMTLTGHSGFITSVVFAPGTRRVVTASADGTARIWAFHGATLHTQPRSAVTSIAFSPDGAQIIAGVQGGAGGTARIWNAVTGSEHQILAGGHSDGVWSVAFSPDSTTVVTTSMDKTAILWDADTGKELRTLTGHTGQVLSGSFSPDGKSVVTASTDRTVKIWDVVTGNDLRTFIGHTGTVLSAAFSPDGTRVITTSTDRAIRIWNAGTGDAVELRGDNFSIWQAAIFNTDGSRVIAIDGGGTIQQWDVATHKTLGAIPGRAEVDSAAFSPDGKYIVTANDDKTIRLWDAGTGQAVGLIDTTPYLAVHRAVFSPDGKRIILNSLDTVIVDFCDSCGTPDELLALVRMRITRDFTEEERGRYLHELASK